MGRESKHDAVRDFLTNFAEDERPSFETVDKIDTVHVTEDDDLQAVIDENGGQTKYILGPGEYRGNFKAPYSDMIVQSEYQGEATIVIDDPTENAFDVTGVGGVQGALDLKTKIRFRDLEFDGRFDEFQSSFGGRTLHLRWAGDVVIENCTFRRAFSRGVSVQTTPEDINHNVWIVNNRFENNERNAIFCSANGVHICDNTMDGCGDVVIDCNQGQDYTIRGNIYTGDRSGASSSFIGVNGLDGDISVVGNDGYGIGGRGVSVDDFNAGVDQDRVVIVGNTLKDDGGNGSVGIDVESSDHVLIGQNVIQGFSRAVQASDASSITINGVHAYEPGGGNPMVHVHPGDGPVADVTIKNCDLNGLRADDSRNNVMEVGADGVTISDCDIVEGGRCIVLTGASSDTIVRGCVVRRSNAAVRLESVTGCRVVDNELADIDNNASIVETGSADENVIEDNTMLNDGSVRVEGGNTVYRNNDNYPTEATGATTVSGDGTTTTFMLDDHNLANGPQNESSTRSNISVVATPVTSDAVNAAPVTGYAVDDGSNGTFDAVEVVFSSAPADGTDNVTIRWEARLSGVRGR